MRIAILSSFWPYRGGIAQFNANLIEELSLSHTVRAFNYKRQYPKILFPGKRQTVTNEDSAKKVESTPILDSINPISYYKTAKEIAKWKPDLLIMRYWNTFFAPAQGFVARAMPSSVKVISILDNVIPHERRFIDTPFTKYFLKGNNAFVVLSGSVGKDLLKLKPDAHYTTIPHPVYNHFGEKVQREFAEKELGLQPNKRNLLFFGLIREYKGLDILIEAFSKLDNSYQLIIAGESYEPFDSYQKSIDELSSDGRVTLIKRYIPDSEVPLLFSAADVAVLPYRTATQSGIGALAYHFEVPLITTDVGGLKEMVEGPGTGIIVDRAQSDSIAEAIKLFFEKGDRESYISNIKKEKERLSWSNFAKEFIKFSEEITV